MSAAALHVFRCATLPAAPWKNGGGTTREIVCQPPGAGMEAFDWRASIARIAADGPFSVFAGVDRVITLLEGGGVRLRSDAWKTDHALRSPLRPFAFAGEARVDCRLLSGACEDFNVMTRRAVCRAEVTVCRHSRALPVSQGGVLLAAQGDWLVCGHLQLPPQTGAWWHGRAPAWELEAQTERAALLAVTIHEVAGGRENGA